MAINAFVHAVILFQPQNAAFGQLVTNTLQLLRAIHFPGQMVQPGRWLMLRRRLVVGAKDPGALLACVLLNSAKS